MAEVHDHLGETNNPVESDVNEPTVKCGQCYGTGKVWADESCPACGGTGRYMSNGPTRVHWDPKIG